MRWNSIMGNYIPQFDVDVITYTCRKLAAVVHVIDIIIFVWTPWKVLGQYYVCPDVSEVIMGKYG